MKNKSFSHLLSKLARTPKAFDLDKEKAEAEIKELQLELLKIQQGIFQCKDRVVVMFEGFDAAGKGGAIKRITEVLDPRGVSVIPIGAPSKTEQGKHWLYRFWKKLPARGNMTIFDRSWYGRVLVEKVEGLTPEKKLKDAYTEINQFEAMLQNDGIKIIKIFLAITKDEQLQRFTDRLSDPYKHWKIIEDDIRARKHWDGYVKAVDKILLKTNLKSSPWHVIAADSKPYARREVVKLLVRELKSWGKWIDKEASGYEKEKLLKLLKNS